MILIPPSIRSLISQVRSFGALGEHYQIIAIQYRLNRNDWSMVIQLLETGELMTYRYSQIVYDPLIKKPMITRVPL